MTDNGRFVSHPTWPGRALLAVVLPAALVASAAMLHTASSAPRQVAAVSPRQASCSTAPLATLGGLFGQVVAGNQQGLAVGAATDPTGVSHAVLWRSDLPQRLATGAAESIAVAVNARGDVVGTGRSEA